MFTKKKQQTKTLSSAARSTKLYLNTPTWLMMLKVGGTGIIMSLVLALFIFVDQLMLVNLMPQTTRYDFNNLFFNNNGLFFHCIQDNFSNYFPLFQNNSTNTKNLIEAIGNTAGLGIYNSSSIVRSAVSLATAVLFIVRSLPGVMSAGASVLYAKALGSKNFGEAKAVWQNAFIGAMLGSLVGFLITIILIPTVTPTQAATTNLTMKDVLGANYLMQQNLARHGYYLVSNSSDSYNIYYVLKNNQFTYYLQTINHNQVYYISLKDNLVTTLNFQVFTTLVPTGHFSVSLVGNANSIHSLWNQYFASVRNYSIEWSENFLYVMDLVAIIQCFVNLLIGILRVEGELKITTTLTVITVCLNILLDWVFISKAQIGMDGAATASCIGFASDLIALAILLQFGKHSQYANFKALKWKEIKLKGHTLLSLFLLGLNNLVSGLGLMILFILLTQEMTKVSAALLPGDGSEYYLSMFGAVMPFINLTFAAILGFALNTVQLFSFNYAANRKDRVISSYWFGTLYLLIIAVIIFVLFGICNPIKIGVLGWFDINANSSDSELQSALKMMLIWMTQIIAFSIMAQATVIYLASNRIKTAILVALIRTVIVPIPTLYIFGFLATHDTQWFNGTLTASQIKNPSENNAMWFFLSVIPSYTAIYSIILFIMSSTFVHTTMFKYVEIESKIKRIKIIQA